MPENRCGSRGWTCASLAEKLRLAWLMLPHMLSISLSGTQSHWSTAKNRLSRDNPVPQLKTGRQSYVKNHLPGSPNESGTVAVGQRRAARCVLLQYKVIQCSNCSMNGQIYVWKQVWRLGMSNTLWWMENFTSWSKSLSWCTVSLF